MRILRTTTWLLFLPALFAAGCASTSGVSPRLRTVASVGDKPEPVVTGEPGASVRADATIPERPRKNEGRLSGRVVDEQGEPIPNVRVRLAVENASAGRVVSVKTDHTGAFTLRGVRPGKNYTVIAEDDEEGLSGRAEAEAPDTDVRITLASAGSEVATVKKTSRKPKVNAASDREPVDEEEDVQEPARASKKPRVNLEDIEPPPASAADAMESDDPHESISRSDQAVTRTSRWRASGSKPDGQVRKSGGVSKALAEDDSGTEREGPSSNLPPPDDDGVDPLPPAREKNTKHQTSQAESSPEASALAALEGGGETPATSEESLAGAEPAPLPMAEAASKEATAAPQKEHVASSEPVKEERDASALAGPLEPESKVVAATAAIGGAALLPETVEKGRPIVINPNGSSIDDLEKLAEASSAAMAPKASTEAPTAAQATDDPFAMAAAKQSRPTAAVAKPSPAQKVAAESFPEAQAAPEKVTLPSRKRMTWGELASMTAKPEADTGSLPANAVMTDGRPRLTSLPGAGGVRSHAAPSNPDDGKAYCDFDSKSHRIRDFRLPDLEGKPVRFQDMGTDLVLIDFWGTWCRPCLRSVPRLVELQKKLGGQKLTVLGVACEEGSPEERVKKVQREARRLGINYPILMSGMDGPCPLQEALDIKALPTLILVDRQGRVVWRDQGVTPTSLARLDKFLGTSSLPEGVRRY